MQSHLLDGDEKRIASFGLVDILFAYAYDHRTTEGENTVFRLTLLMLSMLTSCVHTPYYAVLY